jgi:hypothetical protein
VKSVWARSPLDLNHADLSGQSLAGEDLEGADLTFSDLTGANLAGANLTSANLTGANLTFAKVTGLNLSGYFCSGSRMPVRNRKSLRVMPPGGGNRPPASISSWVRRRITNSMALSPIGVRVWSKRGSR